MTAKPVTALEVRADVDRAVSQINKLTNAYNKSQKQISQLSDRTRRLGNSFSSTSRTMGTFRNALGLLGLGTIGFQMRQAASQALEFDRAMTNVQKTTDITGGDLQRLGSQIKDVSEYLGESATELARVTGLAGQLGIRGSASLLKFTEVVAKLQRATNIVGEEGATQLARVLQLTGTDVLTGIEKLGSVIVRLGNNLATTEAEFLAIAETIAPAMRIFESSAEDVLSFSGAIASVGVEGAAAATALLRLFAAMEQAANNVKANAKEMRVFAEVIGMTVKETEALIKNDKQLAAARFLSGLGQVSNPQEVLSATVTPAFREQKALLAQANDIMLKALEMGRDEAANPTELARETVAQLESTAGRVDQSLVKMRNAFIETGDVVLKVLLPALEFLAFWARKFRDAETRDEVVASLKGNQDAQSQTVTKALKYWDYFSEIDQKGIVEIADRIGRGVSLVDDYSDPENPNAGADYTLLRMFNSLEGKVAKIETDIRLAETAALPENEKYDIGIHEVALEQRASTKKINTKLEEDAAKLKKDQEDAASQYKTLYAALNPLSPLRQQEADIRDLLGNEHLSDDARRQLNISLAQTIEQAKAEERANRPVGHEEMARRRLEAYRAGVGGSLARAGDVRGSLAGQEAVVRDALRGWDNPNVYATSPVLLDILRRQDLEGRTLRRGQEIIPAAFRHGTLEREFTRYEELANARGVEGAQEREAEAGRLKKLTELDDQHTRDEAARLRMEAWREEYRHYERMLRLWTSLGDTVHRGLIAVLDDAAEFEDVGRTLLLQMRNNIIDKMMSPIKGALDEGLRGVFKGPQDPSLLKYDSVEEAFAAEGEDNIYRRVQAFGLANVINRKEDVEPRPGDVISDDGTYLVKRGDIEGKEQVDKMEVRHVDQLIIKTDGVTQGETKTPAGSAGKGLPDSISRNPYDLEGSGDVLARRGMPIDLRGAAGSIIDNQFSKIGSGRTGDPTYGDILADTVIGDIGERAKALLGLSGGGNIREAGLAVVGERGPEIVHLPKHAKVTPLDPMDKMSGRQQPTVVNLTVNGVEDPVVFDRVIDKNLPRISQAVKGEIMSNVGDNSDFSRSTGL